MEAHLVLAEATLFSAAQYWILLLLALGFGLYMAWSIGANDVANAMGTSVGSRALTLTQAIIVAGLLEFAGAFLVGPHVSETIRKNIVPVAELATIEGGLQLYVFGMLAALLAAAFWLMVATFYGLPVSTTHSIVGAVLGFGIIVFWGNWGMIRWGVVGTIVLSWVVSPLLAGGAAFFIFTLVRRLILFQRDIVGAARRVAPYFVFGVFEVITLVTLWKGLKHLNLPLSDTQAVVLATTTSGLLALGSVLLLRRVVVPAAAANPATPPPNPIIAEELEGVEDRLGRAGGAELRRVEKRLRRISRMAHADIEARLLELGDRIAAAREDVGERVGVLAGEVGRLREQVAAANGASGHRWGTPELQATEKIFAYLQIVSACSVAFAHGANDVANSVGPLSGIVNVLQHEQLGAKAALDQTWLLGILAVGGLGIVVGLATWGWRVIDTIGRRITELTPTRGFSAEFGAAATILVASRIGLPISTTHTLVGAVLGVGFARGIGALNLRVVRDIVVSWVVTIPVGAALAVVFFLIFRLIFGS